ncbi:MAG: hypothetical protein K2O70_00820, partial [Desulfovibrionaceae bacterium]|nr:hypothetical protein [Desulfovibrionaceae bacterium]
MQLLSDINADAVCQQVDGAGGIPGASSAGWFVLEVDGAWLQTIGGAANLALEGKLKDAATLQSLGTTEGENLTLDIKAVAVEHQGFDTATDTPLDATHGYDTDRENNVAVKDIPAGFTYAVADGAMEVEVTPAYEGQQEFQHEGKFDKYVGGASITLAPQDESEVFTELTLNYSNAHGTLTLSGTSGAPITLQDGAKLVFTYDDAAHPTECLSVEVWQPGDTAPSAKLSYADASGRGMELKELTSGYLSYLPDAGDNDDADVPVHYSGTALETESGATAPVSGALNVVVDAVADQPKDTSITAVVKDSSGVHPDATPGSSFTVTLEATFGDYQDGSEAHYIFIAKADLPTGGTPKGIPTYAPLVSDPTELAEIFTALRQDDGGTGIHAGTTALNDYYVLKVDPSHLAGQNGKISFDLEIKTSTAGLYHVEAKAVAIEHQGYATDMSGIDGGTDRDILAENNVAVKDMSFDLVVREFKPGKVTVTAETEWAFENDRSEGDEEYHDPIADINKDRDHGVRLLISGQGEGVVSSITFEYLMPSNGSPTYHEIESLLADGSKNPNVTSTYNTTDKPGYVIVTVTAADPFTGVGDLHFIPGDNYDNDDVDITVTQVEVADPGLHIITSSEDAAWGTGVADGAEPVHVKVDAVAQAPEVDNLAVSNDAGNPVRAGDPITITGTLSYEDLQDGSEEHFFLLEIQDGYYPDEVILKFNGTSVPFKVQHYQNGVPANYTLQELVTQDDGQPHLFIKLPVDEYLHQLMGDAKLERMDDIRFEAIYQTREWAQEGVAIHFAAAATEDVEEVREFDELTLDITNDELPFDKLLEQYVPGLKVMDNNTAITIAAQGAYVFWDEYDSELLNFKGYVFENDRPSDHQREPAYSIHRNSPINPVHEVHSFPVDPALQPFDPVANTGRDYGTGVDLKIPEHTSEISITQHTGNLGQGDFYFLPQSVWTAYMTSPAPLADTALAGYRVPPDGTVVSA